ncbi:MAG TPA: T9SS type A sorting domain-containing protein [Bacteroidia bacterium]|nr:T9SS type A sorting domain-containing protein [Bacteroidia bacterium]
MKFLPAFIFCICIAIYCEAQITFQKTYGKFGGCGLSVEQTQDGGYIIAGWEQAGMPGSSEVCLVKTDSYGDTLWTRRFGSSNSEIAYSVQQTYDGGYVICGETQGFGAGSSDVYLIRTDNLGNMLWSKAFGNQYDDHGYSILETNDNGYIIAGYNRTIFSNDFHVYVIKTDVNGDTLWTKNYGDNTSWPDYGNSIRQTLDNGYIISGSWNDSLTASSEVYLLKSDSSGNVLWSKTYGSTGNEWGYYAEQTNDSGYIVAGITNSFGIGRKGYLIKTNATGDTLWTKIYYGVNDSIGDNSRSFNSVHQTSDGGYIVSGYTHNSASNRNAFLLKTDDNGNITWYKSFGGSGYDEGEYAVETDDNGFVFAGCLLSFSSFGGIYLIKVNGNGSGCNEINSSTIALSTTTQVTNVSTSVFATNTIVTTAATTVTAVDTVVTLCSSVGVIEINNRENAIPFFPNPATTEIRIKNQESRIKSIEIYNVLGEKMFSRDVTAGNTDVLTINTAAFTAGIYFVSIKTTEGIETRKLVVER